MSGTVILACLFAILAFRVVRTSYSRPTRETAYRGAVAALGAGVGSFAAAAIARAILPTPVPVTPGEIAHVAAIVASTATGAAFLGFASLVGLVVAEDRGLRIPG